MMASCNSRSFRPLRRDEAAKNGHVSQRSLCQPKWLWPRRFQFSKASAPFQMVPKLWRIGTVLAITILVGTTIVGKRDRFSPLRPYVKAEKIDYYSWPSLTFGQPAE